MRTAARLRTEMNGDDQGDARGSVLVMVLVLVCVLGGTIAAVISLQFTTSKAQTEVTGAGTLGLRNVTVSGDSAIDEAIAKLRQRPGVGVDGGTQKCKSSGNAGHENALTDAEALALLPLAANPTWEAAVTQFLTQVPAITNVRPPVTVLCVAHKNSGRNITGGGTNWGTVLTTLGGTTNQGQPWSWHGAPLMASEDDRKRQKSPFCDDFSGASASGDLPCETGLEAGRGVQNTEVSLVAQGDPAFMGNLINSNSSIVVNSFGHATAKRKIQVVGDGFLYARQHCVGYDSAAAAAPITTNIQEFIMTGWTKETAAGEGSPYAHKKCYQWNIDTDPWTIGYQRPPLTTDPMSSFHHELWKETDCGTLPADHAVDYTDQCGKISAANVLGAPQMPITIDCYSGFVKFEPGYYDNVGYLDQFWNASAPAACKNAVLYFSPEYGDNGPSYETGPGVYYMDFTSGTDRAWGPPVSGKMPMTVVGGTPPVDGDDGDGLDENGYQAWIAEGCEIAHALTTPDCPVQPRKRLRYQSVAFSGAALPSNSNDKSNTNEMKATKIGDGQKMLVSLPRNGDKSTTTYTKEFTALTNAFDPYSGKPLVKVLPDGDGKAAGAAGDNPLKDGVAVEVAYNAPASGKYGANGLELEISAGGGTCTLKLPTGNYIAGNGVTQPLHVDLTGGCKPTLTSSTGVPITATKAGSFPVGVDYSPATTSSWTYHTGSAETPTSNITAALTMKQGAAGGSDPSVVAELDGIEFYVNYAGPPAPDFPNACDPAPGAKGVQMIFGGESRIYLKESGLATPYSNTGLNFELCGSMGATDGGSEYGPALIGLSDHTGTSPACDISGSVHWQSCGQVGAPWVKEGGDLVDTSQPCTFSASWGATSNCTTLKQYVAKTNTGTALEAPAAWATSNDPLTMSFKMPANVVPSNSTIEAIEFQVEHAEGGAATDSIQRVDVDINGAGANWNTGSLVNATAIKALMNNVVDPYRCGGGTGTGGAAGLAADTVTDRTNACPAPDSTAGGIPITNSSTLTTWRWGGRMDTKPTAAGVAHDATNVNPNWPWERTIVDSAYFNDAAKLHGATVTFTITPKAGSTGKYAKLKKFNMRIIYRPPGTLRPLNGCLTIKPAYNWDDTMMGTDRDWAAGAGSASSGIVSKGAYDPNMYPTTCALLISDGPRIHINGSVYAPTAALDLSGSDNDSSFNSNALIARHLTITGWANSVETSLGSDASIDEGHRTVTLYAWRTDTSPPRKLAEVTVDLDDSVTSGNTTVVTSWIRYE